MKNSSSSLSYSLLMGLFMALLTAACGKKPDGTPYGVDPSKLPEGRKKAQAATTIYHQDMPKGAELNAVTNGAKAGHPTSAPSQTPASR